MQLGGKSGNNSMQNLSHDWACPPPNRRWLFCIWPILHTWKPWEADQLELPERFIQELLCLNRSRKLRFIQELLWAKQESKGHLGPVEPLSPAIFYFSRDCNKWILGWFCCYWLVCSMFVALVDVFCDDILMKAIHDNHSHQNLRVTLSRICNFNPTMICQVVESCTYSTQASS